MPEPMTTSRSSCLAVAPACNEAATIDGVVGALRGKAPQLDVAVIDHGSTDHAADGTAAAGACVLQLPSIVHVAQRQAVPAQRLSEVEHARSVAIRDKARTLEPLLRGDD
jgi:hypothetical protein